MSSIDHKDLINILTLGILKLWIVIRTGNTAKYNYGDESENKKHYGQPTSPLYNVSRIPKDIPLLFGYGGTDSLTFDVNDVKHLLDNLKDHQRTSLW